jgi:hypothetical protein
VVEAVGYFDRSAKDFRHSMDAAGLRCVSTHHPLNVLETQLDQWLDYGHTIGLEYMVCSTTGGMHRDPASSGPPTLDDWRWIAGKLNRSGEKVKTAGMTLGVHNHVPKIAVIGGVLVYGERLRLRISSWSPLKWTAAGSTRQGTTRSTTSARLLSTSR